MIYKNIFLTLLLVPVSVICNNANEKQIQTLKNDVFQRGLKLSELSDVILKKQDLINEIILDCKDIVAMVCKSLNKQEEKEFLNEITNFGIRLDNALAQHDVRGFITNEFFNDSKNNNELAKIKSLLIKRFIETEILRELVRGYEEYLQETLSINNEIIKLQK